MSRETFEALAARTAAELEQKIATCHEVVECPKCGAPIGRRCVRVSANRAVAPARLKHPHRERWTRVVPDR